MFIFRCLRKKCFEKLPWTGGVDQTSPTASQGHSINVWCWTPLSENLKTILLLAWSEEKKNVSSIFENSCGAFRCISRDMNNLNKNKDNKIWLTFTYFVFEVLPIALNAFVYTKRRAYCWFCRRWSQQRILYLMFWFSVDLWEFYLDKLFPSHLFT